MRLENTRALRRQLKGQS
ncbi:hypothetical protein Godav_021884 [Gossypium davidsonii]|uniref:Uncharacterized protein n=1 Tax=Gossypium davidsonii TaxID=34287 RepID=A0A7J8TKY8_GOSDV|nr:hypothetical protein [Gossypium davidsonii]